MSPAALETATKHRGPAPRGDRAAVARRGARQGHAAPGRGRPRAAGAAAHRRVPGLREVHPGPAVLGSAGHGAAAVRNLPGKPPPRGIEGAGPGRGREAAHADRREDPAAHALRPDPAVARAAFLPPLVAGPAVRLRLRRRAAQHRGCGRGLPRRGATGRAAPQVRAGSHPPHGGQAHPRHGLGPGRREQEPDRGRARRTQARHLPGRGLEPRLGAPGATALRGQRRGVPRLRQLPRPHALPGARGRRARPLSRGPARARRRQPPDLRPRGLLALLGPDLRGGEGLVLHEVPVPALARARGRLVPRRARSRA